MKKLILSLFTIWSLSLSAQAGSQPLQIANITILPNGCNDTTATLKVTASGGQPTPDGAYTYRLDDVRQIAQTAVFQNVTNPSIFITDSANNTILAILTNVSSSTALVSMDIVSLPLGEGNGCIALKVIKSPEANTGSVAFELVDVSFDNPIRKIINEAPFEATLPFASTTFLNASVLISNDCSEGQFSQFSFLFPFPKGIGNTLKTYLVNNYCSCS